jgi:cullin-4
VQGLLDLKDAMDSIISFAFSGSELFMTTLRSSLESSINARQDRPAELIAKYVDARMKSGGQDSEMDCQRALDKVMILFRCIHGKDVFEAYYKKDLAKRLLLARSQATDLEKYMVMMLKGECGAAFTENLEYMFEDIKLTRELNDAFAAETAASAASSSANNVGLYVHVLTTSHWPSYPAMPVNLPEDFASAAARFQSFYSSKHRKTRLTWLPSVSYCLLRASFPNGRKDLDVSQLQALVLLLFNSQSSMSAAEIREATGIAGDELTRTLQSLSLGQVRVLKKESKGREVIDADVFSYNADFTHSLVRIKINQIQIKETKVEQDATNEKIVEDRQHVIDAVIVRIMKSRKVIKHLQLMTEVLAQLRFSAQAADIKKRIASLIEREYMARQDDDSSAYVYVS